MPVAGLAAKIDREEAYHRMHAEMWHERLRDEPRFRGGGRGAVAVRARRAPAGAARRARGAASASTTVEAVERGDAHATSSPPLWEEMTMVRRSAPAGAQW